MNELFFILIGAAAPVVFGFFYLKNQSLQLDYRIEKSFDYLIMTDDQRVIHLPPVERIIEIRIDNVEIAPDKWQHQTGAVIFNFNLMKGQRVEIIFEVIA